MSFRVEMCHHHNYDEAVYHERAATTLITSKAEYKTCLTTNKTKLNCKRGYKLAFRKDKKETQDSINLIPFFELIHNAIPRGLMARIPGFHPGGPGSIPGVGEHLFRSFLLEYRKVWSVLMRSVIENCETYKRMGCSQQRMSQCYLSILV